ncbi:germination protein, Ger(x)C family [Thermoanaerobacterium xylanolyticum LX-11]|uniref:Germination protein, Ger(X)C family n=1 Tax=Thermoanaerobacterium xylanolyticum (strain ATCC 49914 / DSM 7097 / LX-11) TaxID=858215 RepID=F6BGB0_THEXL|nr:Ger(x)C family spore germination protein [Thermoanaerobacterium xylanolyticum]AEF16328.1 germination protein, Ger(x)C family [Thermoanaerobacterium xylanolyticum LX-11]
MKRVLILFIILSLLLTGCWDKREINELAFVQGIGMDIDKDKMCNITVQILKPANLATSSGGGGGGAAAGKPYEVYSSRGVDFAKAFSNFNTELSRTLFLQHNEIIFIGENLARSGVYSMLDFITRNPEFRRTSYLVVVSGGTLDDLMKLSKNVEKYPYREILGMIQNQKNTSSAYVCDINHFVETLETEKVQPIVGRLEIVKKDGKPQHVRFVGAAAFKYDKMVGFLTEQETKGIMWMDNLIKNTSLVVDKGPKGDRTHISFTIIKANSTITPKVSGEDVSFDVKINFDSNMIEQNSRYNLTDLKMIKSLENLQQEKVKSEVLDALNAVQKKYKVDSAGLGQKLQEKYPKVWEKLKDRWDEIYPNVKVNVSVKATLKRSGLTSKPIEPR